MLELNSVMQKKDYYRTTIFKANDFIIRGDEDGFEEMSKTIHTT